MNRKYSTLKYTLISLFLIACLTIPVMAATDNPDYPMTLTGGVIINGADAPSGTIIEAKEGNKLLGTTTVQTDGEYGNTVLNKLPVTKPDGTSVDLYVKLPTMSSSAKVANIIWGSNDKIFNINANLNSGSNDGGSGGGGMGGASSATETDTETSGGGSANIKESANTDGPTATESLKTGIEDTVFQTREAATDNMILSSILVIGFIAMLLLGYTGYKKT